MPRIDPSIIIHKLSVDLSSKPVRQKNRNFALEHWKAIEEEVQKLLNAGFIREVHYPIWLSNVVMVKKANGKWRICIDFTNLNRAYPKDSFPLSRIDHLVDTTTGYELLSFTDAFSGYNQIKMHPDDEENTSFITEHGTYCYRVMPFGLKNARATYQRLVDKVFKEQMGRNIKAYVDDMVVKSLKVKTHVSDLVKTFTPCGSTT
ncbi:PREDICTED: uncharacterized protein LOC109114857 [Nelumbo nucifera]|uniref:Uncharacterized protein LOC109114857 n=1 Tax=Nelumbo nucifera TaxID=4432 RepID=A0A1U8Q4F7_NELNU|nr:PREDICTED: uncharacterized protein LOC109114857 [Nelumbo nucifera]